MNSASPAPGSERLPVNDAFQPVAAIRPPRPDALRTTVTPGTHHAITSGRDSNLVTPAGRKRVSREYRHGESTGHWRVNHRNLTQVSARPRVSTHCANSSRMQAGHVEQRFWRPIPRWQQICQPAGNPGGQGRDPSQCCKQHAEFRAQTLLDEGQAAVRRRVRGDPSDCRHAPVEHWCARSRNARTSPSAGAVVPPH